MFAIRPAHAVPFLFSSWPATFSVLDLSQSLARARDLRLSLSLAHSVLVRTSLAPFRVSSALVRLKGILFTLAYFLGLWAKGPKLATHNFQEPHFSFSDVAFFFREFTISVNRVSRALVQLKAVLFTLAFFWPLGQRPEIRAAFRVWSLECSFPVEWGLVLHWPFFGLWTQNSPPASLLPFSKNPSSHFLRLHLF